jgi:hypothetical protein
VTDPVAESFAMLRLELSRRLGLAADVLVKKHQDRLSVPNPPPHLNSSKPGQYPRLRTATLELDVTLEADEKAPSVGVGHGDNAPYHASLAASGRLSLHDTAMAVRTEMAAAVEAG